MTATPAAEHRSSFPVLVVVASRTPTPADDDAYVLRLAGVPDVSNRSVPGLATAAARAAARLRGAFPDWLWEWIQRSGALDLAQYPGPISWWWYTPLSEMSPIRSRLVRDLYWLLILDEVLREVTVQHVRWIGDDAPLARAAAGVIAARAKFSATIRGSWRSRLGGVPRQILRRARMMIGDVVTGAALRAMGVGVEAADAPDVLLFSRFPVLWERRGDEWMERMFADWPQLLASRGHRLVNAVLYSGSVRGVVAARRSLADACRRYNIVILDALWSVPAVIRSYCDVGFLARYVRWRRRFPPAVFEGIDVRPLLRRQLDADVAGFEVPRGRLLHAAVNALAGRHASLKTVFFPFEYQPIERAVTLAARGRGARSVGLQTGLFTSNQMGFTFPAAQVREDAADARRAPLPDALAAYGELPFDTFRARLGDARVILVGPIRYARLGRKPEGAPPAPLATIPLETRVVLVTTSTVLDESLRILEASFYAAASLGGVFLAIKFHYHLPLHREVERLGREHPGVQCHIFESHLDELLVAASALVCGGSSTAIEAMARGTMPLVLNVPADFLPNPVLDVADAAFLWSTPEELVAAISAVFRDDEAASGRRARWGDALRAQLSPLTSDMNERLYDQLTRRLLLPTPDAAV